MTVVRLRKRSEAIFPGLPERLDHVFHRAVTDEPRIIIRSEHSILFYRREAKLQLGQVNSTTDPRTGSDPVLNNNIAAGTESPNSSYLNPDGFFGLPSISVPSRPRSPIPRPIPATNAPALINNFTPAAGHEVHCHYRAADQFVQSGYRWVNGIITHDDNIVGVRIHRLHGPE